MCLLLHKEYDMLTVWKGGECVIQSRSNLTPDEDDPSWLEAYRFTVWEVEANAKLHAVCNVLLLWTKSQETSRDFAASMVFYSATTPDFNLTWVAMQGSTREQILTKEEIRPICHELGSLSFGLAWRAGITNALQTHSMAWHVPVRSETFFSTPACPKVLQRSCQSASMHENWWICSKIHGHNLRCDPKDQLRPQIHSFGSFGGRDFAKRPAWWKESMSI